MADAPITGRTPGNPNYRTRPNSVTASARLLFISARIAEGMTCRQIADAEGATKSSVNNFCVRYDLRPRLDDRFYRINPHLTECPPPPRIAAPASAGDGESDLWAAVVAKAFSDACTNGEPVWKMRPTGDAKRDQARLSDLRTSYWAEMNERSDAWKFLTETSGDYQRHRDWICGLMNADGATIREAALKRGPTRILRAFWAEPLFPFPEKATRGREKQAAPTARSNHSTAEHSLHTHKMEQTPCKRIARITTKSDQISPEVCGRDQ